MGRGGQYWKTIEAKKNEELKKIEDNLKELLDNFLKNHKDNLDNRKADVAIYLVDRAELLKKKLGLLKRKPNKNLQEIHAKRKEILSLAISRVKESKQISTLVSIREIFNQLDEVEATEEKKIKGENTKEVKAKLEAELKRIKIGETNQVRENIRRINPAREGIEAKRSLLNYLKSLQLCYFEEERRNRPEKTRQQRIVLLQNRF